jgi:hypothetical protein
MVNFPEALLPGPCGGDSTWKVVVSVSLTAQLVLVDRIVAVYVPGVLAL